MRRLLAVLLLLFSCAILGGCTYQGTLKDDYAPATRSAASSKLAASIALVDGGLEKGKIVGGLAAYSFSLVVGPAIEQDILKELSASFTSATEIERPSDNSKVDFYAFPEVVWIGQPASLPETTYRLLLRVVIVGRQTRHVVSDYRESTLVKYELPAAAKAAGMATALSGGALAPITEKIKADAVGEEAQKIMREAVDTVVHKFGEDMSHDQKLQFLASVGPIETAPAVAARAPASPYNKFMDAVVVIDVGNGFGSGFFISRDGLIITCRHVVGDAKTVKVKDRSGRTFTGTVLAVSSDRDLALIKVPGSGFTGLPLATDVAASVGRDVVAIGTPEGLSWTMSKGIVSAIRSLKAARVVQTDASIAPGSSGGPLIDVSSGRVVGVASFSEGQGINFAIAADEIDKAFASELATASPRGSQ